MKSLIQLIIAHSRDKMNANKRAIESACRNLSAKVKEGKKWSADGGEGNPRDLYYLGGVAWHFSSTGGRVRLALAVWFVFRYIELMHCLASYSSTRRYISYTTDHSGKETTMFICVFKSTMRNLGAVFRGLAYQLARPYEQSTSK